MIGVIADDLTGAAELGAVGLRYGLHAEIVRSGKPCGDADLVCVDTDSRSCDPAEASRRAAMAADMLRDAGASWIYKKVDSVLRGQVTAEVEAVMKQLRLNRALLLPANPSLGRTIRDGQYYVQGKPINKTEFARDPEYPRRNAHVLRLLKVPETFTIRLGVNSNELLEGAGIVVGETGSPGDVCKWASRLDTQMLPAGGAEFFNALLADKKVAGTNGKFSADGRIGRELYICGSSSETTRKFVVAERRRKTPVFSLPLELMWGAEFLPAAVDAVTQRVLAAFESHPRVLLTVGLPQVHDLGIARKLSNCLVQVSGKVLRSLPVPNVFAEGGATAAELVRTMGWPRLKVCHEWAPGVATLAVEGGAALSLTIKPGTYAWPAKWK